MNRRSVFGVVVAALLAGVLFVAGSAGAQEADPYVGPATSVAPETTVLQPSGPSDQGNATAAVAGETSATQSTEVAGESLAFTGGDVAGLALMGAVLIGGGAILVRARRRSDAVPA